MVNTLKPQSKHTVKRLPKGKRLKWASLKSVKPVVLNPSSLEAKKLDDCLNLSQGINAGKLNLLVL